MFRKNSSSSTTAGIGWSIAITYVLVLASLTGAIYAQSWNLVHLTRGKVWASPWNSGQLGNVLDVPGPNYELAYPGYSIGAIAAKTPNHARGWGLYAYGERDDGAHAYTIESRAYVDESRSDPLEEQVLIKNYNLLDSSIPAEEIAAGAMKMTEMGMTVHMRNMVWSDPRYDDFVIHEYTITNTATTTISNFHFSHRAMFQISQMGNAMAGGPSSANIARYGDDKYGWDATNNLFYVYDDQSYNAGEMLASGTEPTEADKTLYAHGPGPTTGDIGDPANLLDANAATAELLSAAYGTSVILDSAGAGSFTNVQHAATGCTPQWCPQRPDHETNFFNNEMEPPKCLAVQTYQQPRMSWDEANADASNPDGSFWERQPEIINTCGPFELAAGASITLTFATVYGEMDRHKVVAGGVDNVNLLATESKAALMTNVINCKALFNSGYQIADVAPPTPTDGENSLTITATLGGLQVGFPPVSDSYVDPSTGENDLAGYRVYRSTYFVAGPWTEVADIPKASATMEGGNIVYLDPDLPLGVGHYYTVTSYDTGGNESGKVNANRTPVYPERAANLEFPKKVYVVPNPFRINSNLYGVGEELRMEFIGIPSKCVIRIYTPAGDMLRRIIHDDGTGGQAWGSQAELDYQVSEWRQYVTPGVYVYHIESTVSGQEGEYHIGKFAIIR